jgi:riboflavin-specific deaminase-like protein
MRAKPLRGPKANKHTVIDPQEVTSAGVRSALLMLAAAASSAATALQSAQRSIPRNAGNRRESENGSRPTCITQLACRTRLTSSRLARATVTRDSSSARVFTVKPMSWLSELERLQADFAATPGGFESAVPRPFVTAAFAISADGCLSRERGKPTRISGPESLRVTHQLRALHAALLVGVGTVLADDPALTTRLVNGPSPLRVVLDSRLRVPHTARLLHSTERSAWLVTSAGASHPQAQQLAAAGADVVQVPASPEGVALPEVLSLLAASGVRSLMLEGGASVLESFFRSQCIDYVVLTISAERLANPRAVRLGPCTSAALAVWRARSRRERVGVDRLETGPVEWLVPSSNAAHARLAVR